MHPLLKRTLFVLPAILFFSQAIGQLWPQDPPWPSWLPQHPVHSRTPSRTLPDSFPSRWVFTLNPLGLGEAPAAIGAGIGYRLNKRTEIWSETSVLTNLHRDNNFTFGLSPVTGFRQILQFKKYFFSRENFFLACELRYKSFSYRDTNDFYNFSTHDSLDHAGFLSSHYSFGIGVQIGSRYDLSANGRFQLGLMIGFGMKYKVISRRGIPNGYQYLGTGLSTDLNIRDLIEMPGFFPYLPGSVRIVYNFGKRL